MAGTCSMSLRQQITPGHMLGRVTSAFWTIHCAVGPLGAAAMTWAAGRFGVTAVYLVAGAGCTLVAVAARATPVRHAALPTHPDETGRASARRASARVRQTGRPGHAARPESPAWITSV